LRTIQLCCPEVVYIIPLLHFEHDRYKAKKTNCKSQVFEYFNRNFEL